MPVTVTGAGISDMVMRNVNSGELLAYDIENNQVKSATALFVQAMASFAAPSAADTPSTAAFEPAHQTFLTTPHS